MDEALHRAGWIVVAVVLGAYATFLVTDQVFNSHTASSTPIVIRDIMQKGQHHLYGKIYVPSSCDEIQLTVNTIGINKYELAFTTWAEPSAVCSDLGAEQPFDTVVFAPAIGTEFTATLDKVPLPIAVYPTVDEQVTP
jgi:hypothetical protein